MISIDLSDRSCSCRSLRSRPGSVARAKAALAEAAVRGSTASGSTSTTPTTTSRTGSGVRRHDRDTRCRAACRPAGLGTGLRSGDGERFCGRPLIPGAAASLAAAPSRPFAVDTPPKAGARQQYRQLTWRIAGLLAADATWPGSVRSDRVMPRGGRRRCAGRGRDRGYRQPSRVDAQPWRSGSAGRVRSGRYAGLFVKVEADPRGGFHPWLLEQHPVHGPSSGWDAWADDEAGISDWFSTELPDVGCWRESQ